MIYFHFTEKQIHKTGELVTGICKQSVKDYFFYFILLNWYIPQIYEENICTGPDTPIVGMRVQRERTITLSRE